MPQVVEAKVFKASLIADQFPGTFDVAEGLGRIPPWEDPRYVLRHFHASALEYCQSCEGEGDTM